VHALAGQRIQVHRQRGGQRLAFAGAHFGDLAVVQRHAAEQLDVEVAHLHDALGAFAHRGKSLRQQGIEGLALGDAVLELLRLGAQRVVAELLELGFERIDAFHRLAILLEEPVVATAEDLGQEVGCHWVEMGVHLTRQALRPDSLRYGESSWARPLRNQVRRQAAFFPARTPANRAF
jgi:hypothetical protein